MVQFTNFTQPQDSGMFIRRSLGQQGPGIVLDNRGSIGLQVRRDKSGRDCCRRDRPYRKSFDDYIYSQGRWFIYFTYSKMGEVHRFLNFNMVHESRMDEPMFRIGHSDGIYLNSWSPSLVNFFGKFTKQSTDHTHIELYYPTGNEGWRSVQEPEPSPINHSNLNQVPDQVPNPVPEQSPNPVPEQSPIQSPGQVRDQVPNQDSDSDSDQDSDQGSDHGSEKESDKDSGDGPEKASDQGPAGDSSDQGSDKVSDKEAENDSDLIHQLEKEVASMNIKK